MKSTQINKTNKVDSGYDLPITGLDNGEFLNIHIPAICCIFISLIAAVSVILVSFMKPIHKVKAFSKWTKCERFAVYVAICDGFFNICHSMDHLHIVISRNHVYPKSLCTLYAFLLTEFITAQILMVNVISVNTFVLIFNQKDISFGRYDWKLLTWMFGIPFVASIVALGSDVFGPNGTFCYYDRVKGKIADLFFTTILLVIVISINILLYTLTLFRIRRVEQNIESVVGRNVLGIRKSHRAAKRMSLFVAAFLIQWFPMAMYGLWRSSSGDVPTLLFQVVTTFSNLGGVLNGIVYYIIRRKREPQVSDHIIFTNNKINIITPSQNKTALTPKTSF